MQKLKNAKIETFSKSLDKKIKNLKLLSSAKNHQKISKKKNKLPEVLAHSRMETF